MPNAKFGQCSWQFSCLFISGIVTVQAHSWYGNTSTQNSGKYIFLTLMLMFLNSFNLCCLLILHYSGFWYSTKTHRLSPSSPLVIKRTDTVGWEKCLNLASSGDWDTLEKGDMNGGLRQSWKTMMWVRLRLQTSSVRTPQLEVLLSKQLPQGDRKH